MKILKFARKKLNKISKNLEKAKTNQNQIEINKVNKYLSNKKKISL
jgi:ribosomal protein L18E